MKKLLVSIVLLLPHVNQAQTKPRPQVKHTVVKATSTSLQKPPRSIEKLGVGDTCYVITNSLALRGRPEVTSPAAVYLQRNSKVVVREVLATAWVLVDYYSQDVGVEGYVSQQGISHKKADQ